MSDGESSTVWFNLPVVEGFAISFQRTLRVPEDGRDYPLPPSLGAFPIYPATQHLGTPEEWRQNKEFFVPMYQREALWIGLNNDALVPYAVQVGLGNSNAISGGTWDNSLANSPANYLVCPPQPWLDGINAGEGRVRQFVAVSLGSGLSVESQLSAEEEAGGLRIQVFAPKPGVTQQRIDRGPAVMAGASPLGLAAGGRMNQKLYPDPYGLSAWEAKPSWRFRVHLVNSLEFRRLTGLTPPPTLVTAEQYTQHGFPWFALFDESLPTLDEPSALQHVKSLGELDRERGEAPEGEPVEIPPDQILTLHLKKNE